MSNDIPEHCAGDADYHADRASADEQLDVTIGQALRDAKELRRLAIELGLPLVSNQLDIAILALESGIHNKTK